MQDRRNPFVAAEGIPLLAAAVLTCFAAYRWLGPGWLVPALGLVTVLAVVFRDPRRRIPAVPLGIVSPVDGRIVETGAIGADGGEGEALRVMIRIDVTGAYTARSPVEGKVMDPSAVEDDESVTRYPANALWVRTDEGDDVVVQLGNYRLGLTPRSLVRYGERLGQGARCAYLRLAREAEVHVPVGSKIAVEAGDQVIAGRDVIARLPQP